MQFSPRAVSPPSPSQLHAVIERWQQFVLSTDELPGAARLREVRQLVYKMPPMARFADDIMARAIITETLSRLVQQLQLCSDPQTSRDLARLAGSLRSDAWMEDTLALIDGCVDAFEARGEPKRALPPLVRRALRELDVRYREPLLDEPNFAEGLGKSVSYVAHLLTAHTGQTFLQHVHTRRTEEAVRQLTRTSRSAEEIAIAVGYAGPTQLRRHLRERYGLTTRGIRARKRIDRPGSPHQHRKQIPSAKSRT